MKTLQMKDQHRPDIAGDLQDTLQLVEQWLVQAWQQADEIEQAQLRIAHTIVFQVLSDRMESNG